MLRSGVPGKCRGFTKTGTFRAPSSLNAWQEGRPSKGGFLFFAFFAAGICFAA
jgi:hypothetical protein